MLYEQKQLVSMCLKKKAPHDVNAGQNSCKQALRNSKLEVDCGLWDDHKKTRPADIYIDNWGLVGKSAALDVSNTSRLKSEIILEAVVLLLH